MSSHGQVTPSQPTNFKKRDLGTGISPGSVGVGPANPQPQKKNVVTIQYIGVAAERTWTNSKGKTMRGTLLAFENGPAQDARKKPLTIVRDDKVRILRSGAQKPSVVALASLSKADRAFVADLDAANKKAAAETATAAEGRKE